MGDDTPIIIGILSQETVGIRFKNPDFKFNSFISAAYVNFAKSIGTHVVPIFIEREKSYYENIMKNIHGIILPGGGTFFDKKCERNGYANAGRDIYELAKTINDGGVYFPILGICLGMELLIWLSENKERQACRKNFRMDRLTFNQDFKNSKMFAEATDDEISLFKESVCEFHHSLCYPIKMIKPNDNWRIISYKNVYMKYSNHECESIATTVESIKYPFYGLQFHPEKPEFEPTSRCHIDKRTMAIKANQYFALFFKKELQKNTSVLHVNESILINETDIQDTRKILKSSEKCYMYM